MDVSALIRQARLPERTVPLCLRPDLVREYEALQAQAVEVKEQARLADSLAASADTSAIEAELADLEEQMRAGTIPFVFRALPRPLFRALWAKHPPRKDDDDKPIKEDWMGVNSSTFFGELIRASTIVPELVEDDWSVLLDEKLSDRQYHDLANACFDLSQERVEIPFSYKG